MKDQVKKFILQAVLNSAIMAGLIFIIKWGGEYFYVYAWLFVLIVSLVSYLSNSFGLYCARHSLAMIYL